MKPIVVVGAGLAGMAAAWELRRAGVEVLVVEREGRVGGRLGTVAEADWRADFGLAGFRRRDAELLGLLRAVGMETDWGPMGDRVCRIGADGGRTLRVEPDRCVVRPGWQRLFDRLAHQVPVWTGILVDALRWVEGRRAFELRDGGTGRALRHPVSGVLVEAAGVVLAVPGPTAAALAAGSRFLGLVAAALGRVRYAPAVQGIFVVPAVDPGFCLLESERVEGVRWVAVEDRMAPGRAVAGRSVISVRAGSGLSRALFGLDTCACEARLFAECREVVPGLASEWQAARVLTWQQGEPEAESFVVVPPGGIPTEPAGVPVALAGDWTAGVEAGQVVASGRRAAAQVLARLGAGLR
jgi:predicted NAD/FAD-dependent oxidoreductase